ncbi:MAG: Gfo/Idh/MocA family protein [Gammaproteobacteria bacterium]
MLLVGGNRTHQETHAICFAADRRCRLSAVTDSPSATPTSRALSQTMARDLGIPFVEDLEVALNRDDVDVVSLCPQMESRGAAGKLCGESGKAIYLDKPLAGNMDDGIAIRDALRQSLAPNQMYSYAGLPWVRSAKACLDSGAIGALRAIHVDVLFAKGRAGSAPAGLVRRERHPPRAYTFVDAKRELFDLGVYSVGLCLWLSGKRALEVTANTANYFFESHARRDVEDCGAVAMQLEGGVVATATGGRIGYYSHPKGGPHKITLVGSEGTETFDAWTPRIEVSNAEPTPELPPPNPEDPMMMWRSTSTAGGNPIKNRWVAMLPEDNWYAADIVQFLDCLDAGTRANITAEEALESLAVLMAAYESAASGRTVSVPRL